MFWHRAVKPLIRHVLLCYAIFAIMLQMVLPFYSAHALPHTQINREKLRSTFGEWILICNENGFSLVSIDEYIQTAHNSEQTPNQKGNTKCPLCYLKDDYDDSHGLLTEVTHTHALQAQSLNTYKIQDTPLATYTLVKQNGARAPPV